MVDPGLPADLVIRPATSEDPIPPITALVHRSYAALAAMGFRYHATWQDDEVTRKRMATGHCLLGICGDVVVATVTVCSARRGRADAPSRGSPWYDRPGVGHFGQFAVAPDLQGRGLGTELLRRCEAWARAAGSAELACDTAEGATHLIRWYERLGYRFTEHVQWDITNYRSVVLSKRLVE